MDNKLNKIFHLRGSCLSLEQIESYNSKKMSNSEMHLVEKHLLECELCSDAIEGYKNQISQITPQTKSIKTIIWMSGIAASILIAVSLFVFNQQDNQLAENKKEQYLADSTNNEPIYISDSITTENKSKSLNEEELTHNNYEENISNENSNNTNRLEEEKKQQNEHQTKQAEKEEVNYFKSELEDDMEVYDEPNEIDANLNGKGNGKSDTKTIGFSDQTIENSPSPSLSEDKKKIISESKETLQKTRTIKREETSYKSITLSNTSAKSKEAVAQESQEQHEVKSYSADDQSERKSEISSNTLKDSVVITINTLSGVTNGITSEKENRNSYNILEADNETNSDNQINAFTHINDHAQILDSLNTNKKHTDVVIYAKKNNLLSTSNDTINFSIGESYFRLSEKNLAKKHLLLVSNKSEYYSKAQELLKSME